MSVAFIYCYAECHYAECSYASSDIAATFTQCQS
jgi:hypothetical protein